MSSLADYFRTDWSAMTVNDWIGTLMTVLVFLLMVGLYFYVWRPKNRDRLEAQRHIPFDGEDASDSGDKR